MAERIRNILVLGIGKFGTRVVDELSDHRGIRLFVFDKSEAAIERVLEKVHTAAHGDLDDTQALHAFLENTGEISNAVVSLGEAVAPSILATLELMEFGIPEIVVKALNRSHGHALKSIERAGTHSCRIEVIIPEQDAAERLARRLGSKFVSREIPVGPGYALMEVKWPKDFHDRNLIEMDIRRKYGVTVVGYRQPGGKVQVPQPETGLPAGALVTMLGPNDALEALVNEFGEG